MYAAKENINDSETDSQGSGDVKPAVKLLGAIEINTQSAIG
jgi:hypothetical protein